MLGAVPSAHVRTITGLLAASQLGQTVVMPDLSGNTVEAVETALSEFQPWYFESPPEFLQHLGGQRGTMGPLLAPVQLFQTTFSTSNARTIAACLDASGSRHPTYMVTYGQTEVGPICVRLYTRRHLPREPDLCVGVPLIHPRRLALAPRPAEPEAGQGVLFIERIETSPTYVVSMEERGAPSTSCPPDDSHDWHDTGDVLRRTRRGCYHYLGRAGVTDGLVALEGRLLTRLPEASDIVLVRVADEVRPLVVTNAGRPLSAERWTTAVAGATAGFGPAPALASPDYLSWDALPRNPSWKVRRVALAEQMARQGAGS
jgi:acyl-coenzyme A synthetase/AMP-(fatty) acid ligase